MVLPAFADYRDLAARGVDVTDRKRAQAALDDASAVIRAHAGKTWVTPDDDDVDQLDADRPDILTTICIAVARRVLENPDGYTSMTLGDASVAVANATGDVYLKASEKAMIGRAAGRRTVGTIPTTREPVAAYSDLGSVDVGTGTVYVEVTGSEPFPLLDSTSIT